VAGFARRYLGWGLPLCLLCLLTTAWHWSRPGSNTQGVPFVQAAGVLAMAALLLNLPSFWLQRRSLRRQLQAGSPFDARRFALRFYLLNLGLALTLSLLLWRPLLLLLFFYRLYPVAFWLLPYHALLGYWLGRWLQRETQDASDGQALQD
jgi:hypothetical protein